MTFRSTWLRNCAYRIFYRLPLRARGHLVRRLTPNYTVGAVAVVRDEHQRVLLVRQPHNHGWSLPGGLAERGEAPPQTAARELYEEVGISMPPEELKPGYPSARVNPRSQQVDMIFTVTVESDVELRTDPAEIVRAEWHAPDRLPRLTGPTDQLLRLCGVIDG
ncbi:MAG TPA: NUDIX domain-containing protein [Mycobacteriales bacterium]|jgi:8-oxo-dGTP pyrophosphatase MutT (NUDIX family)|nr:NUDIX domain-containing protein [Mycobacteriales bacterium]